MRHDLERVELDDCGASIAMSTTSSARGVLESPAEQPVQREVSDAHPGHTHVLEQAPLCMFSVGRVLGQSAPQ